MSSRSKTFFVSMRFSLFALESLGFMSGSIESLCLLVFGLSKLDLIPWTLES